MLRRILKVAEQEIRIGIRNKWLLLSTLILATLALVLALIGSISSASVDSGRLTVTVASLSTLSVYLIPLIALLLSYDAICGELERGTLLITFSCPITRTEFLIGKLTGHLTVLFFSIMIGYGSIGSIIMAMNEVTQFGLISLVRLILTSVMLGLCFLPIGYILSSLTRQPRTAAAISIGFWMFLIIIYDLVLLGLLIALPNSYFSTKIFPFAILLNPADSFRLFNLATLEASELVGGLAGISETLPYSASFALVSMSMFFLISLAVSTFQIRRLVL